MNHLIKVGTLCALFIVSSSAMAEVYRLGIAPVLDIQQTRDTYAALAKYMSRAAKVEIELVPSRNFIGYWNTMRKPESYDFILDGAHLAAYRMQRMEHNLVATIDGVLSFTLISRDDDLIIEPEELINRKVAILASPNLGGLQIYNLFSNPARQPLMVEVKNAVDALEAVRDGRADAAYVPTPILSRFPEASVIISSEPMPNMTMTASSRVPDEVLDAVRTALIQASSTDEGKAMLETINAVGFVKADEVRYAGLEDLLKGMWGY